MNRYTNTILDTYPYCNAKCVFCSYHRKTQKVHPMSDEIIHKVVDEVGRSEECVEIIPFLYGEPMMNPKLFETCDYISEHAPHAKISLSTNGSLLTPEKIENLLKIKTFYFLNFSTYAGTKETYEKLVGLDFDTLDKIDYAIEMFEKHRPDVRLCVGATEDPRFVTRDDVTAIRGRYGKYVSAHPISFNYQHGMNTRTTPSNTPCSAPFISTVVYCDGRVGVCCFDANADLTIGDVTKTSLYEAINSDLAKKYRCAHSNGLKDVITICRSCTQPV